MPTMKRSPSKQLCPLERGISSPPALCPMAVTAVRGADTSELLSGGFPVLGGLSGIVPGGSPGIYSCV